MPSIYRAQVLGIRHFQASHPTCKAGIDGLVFAGEVTELGDELASTTQLLDWFHSQSEDAGRTAEHGSPGRLLQTDQAPAMEILT